MLTMPTLVLLAEPAAGACARAAETPQTRTSARLRTRVLMYLAMKYWTPWWFSGNYSSRYTVTRQLNECVKSAVGTGTQIIGCGLRQRQTITFLRKWC